MRDRGDERWRRRVIAGILLPVVAVLVLISRRVSLWQLRLFGARLSNRFPARAMPTPIRVLPPPDSEYLGVWERPPTEARACLLDEYGFTQLVRAYLHAYERGGQTQYELASCAYRPNGVFGAWQLHVRLFPTPEGQTDVWCHWERNPNVAPIAHLRQEGYDPETGKRRLQAMLDGSITDAEDTDANHHQ